ncbi:MAG: hypothetical protein ABJF10_11205 [Chthoniobacter sp.]|uniref:hypothetical protein n=1 Tax=Chthoniobacter sp. TaxID=2510640 RepID=UPI0032A762B8
MNRNLRVVLLVPVLFTLGMLMPGAGAVAAPLDTAAKAAQEKLAVFQGRVDAHALDVAWPYLDSPDCAVREVARAAVEAQPFDTWKQRALEEKKPWASLEALRALIEACPRTEAAGLSPHLCEQITTLGIEQMSEAQQLAALQLTRAIFAKLGPVSVDERTQMLDLWSHFPEPLTGRAKAEVTRLLAFIDKAPTR